MATDDSGENIFEQLEAQADRIEPMSRRERVRTWFDLWIRSPLRIIWDDRRTRWGSLIVIGYLIMGTLGVHLTESPELNENEELLGAFPDDWFTITQQTVLGAKVPWPHIETIFGTNNTGQSIFELIVHSTPPMLKMALAGGIATTLVGVIVGTVAGYKGGRIERVLMTATDIQIAIPGLPLLIVVAFALQPRDPLIVGLILSIDAWAGLARQLHSQVLALRSESYAEASRVVGLGSGTIIRDDILPNIMPYIMINFMGNTTRIIHASVGLYFIGVLPYTNLNWGVMISRAQGGGAMYGTKNWPWLLLPILAIALLSYGITILSQGMDRLFNPRVRARQSEAISSEEAPAE